MKTNNLLSPDFLAHYKDKIPPFGGNGLGEFVYLRTYSRWLPEKQRRETWQETCQRVVEYSLGLYQGPASEEDLRNEAEFMYDSLFNLRVFPAGRTLWIGGTDAERKFGSANFNCAFVVMDSLSAFTDLFHLLLVGAGVGFRILPDDVNKLPHFNSNIVVAHKPYNGKTIGDRREDTVMFEESDHDKASVHIVVGDSKAGWAQALHYYLQTMQRNDVESIIFNYDSVRPAGEILKTFGGRASGHQALKKMFRNIHRIIARKKTCNGKLTTLDVLDINNYIGHNVVVGGVRRTSQIALFDISDIDVLNAKVGLWEQDSSNYGNDQRSMSNNSIFFEEKPTHDQLLDIFQRIGDNGEPGIINAQAARKLRPNFQGLNPCGEILLDSQGVCNLTEINMAAFVQDGKISRFGLINAVRLAVRIGLRQTNVTLDLPAWDVIQKRDRLLGVSLDGVMDFVDAADNVHLEHLLEELHEVAQQEAQLYAYEMRVPEPLLVTTEKPSGTLSKLPGISSGIYRGRSTYYVRRVRITATDPLAHVMLDAGYPVYPESSSVGPSVTEFDAMSAMQKWQALQNATTWVIEFPMYSPTKVNSNDESALDQFERYLIFQRCWTDHNTSITINFAPDEIEKLVDAILENWNDYIAISFLPKNTTAYPLLPEEAISAEEYFDRVNALNKNFDIVSALHALERQDMSTELIDASCDTGICPVR